jgi:hypothetical protein
MDYEDSNYDQDYIVHVNNSTLETLETIDIHDEAETLGLSMEITYPPKK